MYFIYQLQGTARTSLSRLDPDREIVGQLRVLCYNMPVFLMMMM